MRKIIQTKTTRTYFRNDARFGRTTTLVDRETSEILAVVMGEATRQQCYAAYINASGRELRMPNFGRMAQLIAEREQREAQKNADSLAGCRNA